MTHMAINHSLLVWKVREPKLVAKLLYPRRKCLISCVLKGMHAKNASFL